MEESLRKRLSLQNEVMRWLNELSEKVERRAKETTSVMNELIEKTDLVEQDLKNVLNSLRALSRRRYIENKIAEEDQMSGKGMEDAGKTDESIPAQSYEADILPRYKEALSLSLSSYRSHMQKISRAPFPCSVFKTGSAFGPLPHVIGSEEYVHDNTCGLPEDLTSDRISLEFRNLEEQSSGNNALNFVSESSDGLFGTDIFVERSRPSKKDGTEPLVSAALDFKAMLEAALLSPYKFYDEESSSAADSGQTHSNMAYSTEQRHSELEDNVISEAPVLDIDEVSSLDPPDVSGATVLPTPGNTSSFVHSDVSALISGSLFDSEEDSPLASHRYSEASLSSGRDVPGNDGGQTSTATKDNYVIQENLVEDESGITVPQDHEFSEDSGTSTSKKSTTVVEVKPIVSSSESISCTSVESDLP
ncbi:hypothetical protein Syun_031628 [Stephania yunnanensis]|uniref:Uncharacterized protein n=1 Tax=Stephania yunnanensis TaxID=152371 RepID=A0AAP0E3R7_9MAGN